MKLTPAFKNNMNSTLTWKCAQLRRPGFLLLAGLCAAGSAFGAAAKPDPSRILPPLTTDAGRIVIEAHGLQTPAPLFFSATAEQVIQLGAAEIIGELKIKLQIVQGRPEVLSLGLSGDGEIVDVSGKGLRDWSVRQAVPVAGTTAPQRFLDVRPVLTAGVPEPRELDLVVHTRLRKPVVPGNSAVLLVTRGAAVGFSSKITLQPDLTIDFKVTSAVGMTPTGEITGPRTPLHFASTMDGRIEVMLTQRGAALAPAEILGAQLTGRVNEATKSVEFRLRGQLRIQKIGARLRVLSGLAALNEKTAGDGWHVELVTTDEDEIFYELVGDREGVLPLDLSFTAAVEENGDWRKLDFQMPAGAVVPLRL
jgi:hypothetical protein